MKIFYILNTTGERSRQISGYFSTLEKAKQALKACSDWYRENGTGKIYSINIDELEPVPELIYEN
ncbi:MAG: hypothetical protein ACI37Z_01120 [Candidatus Gastranaerophilaceae bacterium]